MIQVPRTAPEPAVLARTFPDGRTESDRAIDHYTKRWDGKTPYPFARYKDDEVKGALERLFHGKCAYCESRFGHISPEDIEHWRPKGAVMLADGTERKGAYYWLAATWSNLLPSCIDCNRRRRHEDARDPANTQSGKETLFPVADEAHRWTDHNQPNQNGEEPLLLDPCKDDPFKFFNVGSDAVVTEREPPRTPANKRARKSIDVFGLNRSKLVAERKEHRMRIFGLVIDVRRAIDQMAVLPDGPVKDDTRAGLVGKVQLLKAERDPKSQYLLMKIPLLDDFAAKFGPKLQELGIGI